MYFTVLLALLCVGIIRGQQDIGDETQETRITITRNDHKLGRVTAGKAGLPGKVDYTAVNGTIKKYVKEISRRKLFEIRLAVERNSEDIQNFADISECKLSGIEQFVQGNREEIQYLRDESYDMRRQLTECHYVMSECHDVMEALKEEIKNLQNIIKTFTLDLSTWYKATNGNYYKHFHDSANYTTAKANCKKYGARLATAGIRDDDVRRELLPLMEAGRADTWIGLNDIVEEGTFYWEDGIRADASDSPDNYDRFKNCAVVTHIRNWKLIDDKPCHYRRKYLCEIEI